jgi:D-amino-acid dehydrogenase
MRIIVVGAGLLGLTTAYFLRLHGADVEVIERQSGPALETSFANGGMLHASQANPWNEPGVFWQALRMLGREDAALLIRPRALPRMLGWSWNFLRNSSLPRYLANVEKNARLADYSLTVLAEHLAPLDLPFERADHGTLKIYRTAAELDTATRFAERCRAFDVRYEVLNAQAVARLEPALAPVAHELSGGIHFPDDVSGDAQRFCRALAEHCAAIGVTFDYERLASQVVVNGGAVGGVMVDGEMRRADGVVLAAASYTPALAASAGLKVPVQPVKGYSLTLPMADWQCKPHVPVIDEHYHAAVCPLGQQLRVAGTAEFAGFDTRLTESRIRNLYDLLARIYPDESRRVERRNCVEWTGLRPMSPDGVGIMGRTAVRGLYLNTGHGHLGWTMAPGAGKLVADDIMRERTELPSADYALARFNA